MEETRCVACFCSQFLDDYDDDNYSSLAAAAAALHVAAAADSTEVVEAAHDKSE